MRIITVEEHFEHPGLKLLSGHWGEVMALWLQRLDETFALVRTGRDRDVSDY
jgi:hypothetical protein